MITKFKKIYPFSSVGVCEFKASSSARRMVGSGD